MKYVKSKIGILILAGVTLAFVVSAASTLYEWYTVDQGSSFPTVDQRSNDAALCGIDNYSGTYEQNLRLLDCLNNSDEFVGPSGPENINGKFLEPVNCTRDSFGEIACIPIPDAIFGATAPFRPSEFKSNLGESKTEGHSDTTLKVTTITTKDGNTLSASTLGDIIVLSINSGGSNSEIVLCTGLTVSTLTFTGCTFGQRFDQSGSQASNINAHAPGEPVIISNSDTYLVSQVPTLDGDNFFTASTTFDGQLTYSSSTASILRFHFPNSTTYFWFDSSNGQLGFATSTSGELAFASGGISLDANIPLELTGGVLFLATSTHDFILDGDNDLAIATSTVAAGTASGNRLDDLFNDRFDATTTHPVFTLPDFYYGDGSDGSLTVTSANFHPNSASSTLASAAATSSATITVADASQFPTSTKIFIHSARGENTGNWEINTVTDRNNDTDVVTLATSTAFAYKNTTGADITQILNVPQFTFVEFSSSGDIDPRQEWRAGDGLVGGITIFYASEGVVIASSTTVSLDGFGYKGGVAGNTTGFQGESPTGAGIASNSANGMGGGGGITLDGGAGAAGDDIIGNFVEIFTTLKGVKLIFGSGGGGGSDASNGNEEFGGDGGGIFMPITPSFLNWGTVTVRGANGEPGSGANNGPGGGAAGGMFCPMAEQFIAGVVNTFGGSGGNPVSGSGDSAGGGGFVGVGEAGSTGGNEPGGDGGRGFQCDGNISGILPKQ